MFLLRMAVIGLAMLAAPAMAQDADTVTGPARSVDADIIMVNDQRVILFGIDAPERSQRCFVADRIWACWDAAKATLDTILSEGEVTCTLSGEPDPFNRRLGTCTVGGKDVGEEMVRAGMAMAYLEQSEDYVPAEAEAKTAQLGFWQPNARIDAPWDWRRRNPGGFR